MMDKGKRVDVGSNRRWQTCRTVSAQIKIGTLTTLQSSYAKLLIGNRVRKLLGQYHQRRAVKRLRGMLRFHDFRLDRWW